MAHPSVDDAVAAFLTARADCEAARKAAHDAVPDWPHVSGPLVHAQVQAVTAWAAAERAMLDANEAVLDARIHAETYCC